MNAPVATRPERRLRPGMRRAVLTVHIAASVALLGSCAAIVAIRARDRAAVRRRAPSISARPA